MPMTTRSKQKTDFYDVESEQDAMETPQSAGRSAPPAEAPAVITASDLSAMMTSLQQAQADNFERLLTLVLEGRPPPCSPAAGNAVAPATPTTSSSSAQPASGNFAACKARYSGTTTESLDGFIDAVEAYKDCANVSEANCLRGLSMLLTHDAATWWQGVKATLNSWDEAIQYLRCAFGDSRPPSRIYIELFSRPQEAQERTELFVASARAQLARLPPGDISEKVQLDMIYGLLKHRIRKRLRREEFSDFNTLLRKTRSIEDSLKETPNVGTSKGTAAATRPRIKSPQQDAQTTTRTSTQRASSSTEPTLRQGTPNVDVNKTPVTEKEKRFCVYCKHYGHNRDQCRKLNAKDSCNNLDTNKILSCFGCGESGVIRSNCPKCNVKFSAVDIVPMSRKSESRNQCVSADGNPAAQVSHIDVSPVNNACSPKLFNKYRNICRKCFDRSCQCQTKRRVTMNFPGQNQEIGIPRRATMVLSGQNPEISLPDNVITNVEYEQFIGCYSLSSPHHNNTPRRPILYIEILGIQGTGLIDTAAKGSIAGSTLYALLRQRNQQFTSSSMSIKLADGFIRDVRVLLTNVNITLGDLRIPIQLIIFPDATNNETLLGIDFITKAKLVLDFYHMNWYTADRPQVIHQLSFEPSRCATDCAAMGLLRDDEATLLSESQKLKVANIINEYSDVFDLVGEPTPYAEHVIDTGNHSPIAVPPYRITPAKKEILRAELDQMLSEGIVEECESAWAAPCVLVPKTNGKFRFCVDYRKLNAITKSDAYPMPRIDELVQSTKRNCVMSTLDLRSGYWQVRLKDCDKSAFVTPFGTYRFKRMPFGLKNAPATFQRLIDRFRSGASLKDVTILTYLDDILIISDGFEKHVTDLRAVFDRLRVFKLRANRDKCVFAREQVKYLGHVITPQGISPDQDKVRSILEMKEPKSLQQLRTFIQTCSWFRKFIPDFAKIAEPLSRLTKKSQPWTWSQEQSESFTDLKRLLTTPPILVQADYSKPFILRTDASAYALGAVLLQGESPHDERPIEYASRLLIPAERNYSTTEREALAVVWAVERFRAYIDGHKVCVRSDHQPLKWLFSIKSPSGRLVRWALKLQAFDLQVDYTPGKCNVIADTLSRPVNNENIAPVCELSPVVVEVPRWEASTTRESQLADPEVAKIIQDLEGNDEVASNRWAERGYHLSRGVLYRYVAEVDSEEPQLIIPVSLRSKVMFECHDAPTAAHGGIERTLHRISQRYYFPGMRRFVTGYLKTCKECQRYKPSNVKPAGLLQTPVPAQRFEVIAVDLFGPLPKGSQRWILIIEDTASKWIELFALTEATSEFCAKTLVNEVFMRYGVPRRMISDNGVQFVADVMQKAMLVLGVKQNLVPLYHPEANPVERKNRDLKAQVAILIEGHHDRWPEVLPFVRFSFNSSLTTSTEQTPAYLTFGRELRSPLATVTDLRAIVEAENFVPQITPYLRKLAASITTAKERLEHHQDVRKSRADKDRTEAQTFVEGDLVLMKTHVLSNAAKGVTSKFVPKRDGPYEIHKKVSPTTYLLAYNNDGTKQVIGKYHVSDLRRYHSREGECPEPVVVKRRRGRPRKAR